MEGYAEKGYFLYAAEFSIVSIKDVLGWYELDNM